jgi:hypothetical protein
VAVRRRGSPIMYTIGSQMAVRYVDCVQGIVRRVAEAGKGGGGCGAVDDAVMWGADLRRPLHGVVESRVFRSAGGSRDGVSGSRCHVTARHGTSRPALPNTRSW